MASSSTLTHVGRSVAVSSDGCPVPWRRTGIGRWNNDRVNVYRWQVWQANRCPRSATDERNLLLGNVAVLITFSWITGVQVKISTDRTRVLKLRSVAQVKDTGGLLWPVEFDWRLYGNSMYHFKERGKYLRKPHSPFDKSEPWRVNVLVINE